MVLTISQLLIIEFCKFTKERLALLILVLSKIEYYNWAPEILIFDKSKPEKLNLKKLYKVAQLADKILIFNSLSLLKTINLIILFLSLISSIKFKDVLKNSTILFIILISFIVNNFLLRGESFRFYCYVSKSREIRSYISKFAT